MTKFLYNKITINIWQETILYPNRTHRHLKNPYKAHKYKLCRDLPFYSNSTITNQFCLEIIGCRVRFSFNYLIYPYYPAYMG